MARDETDILIAGGGIAGMIAALALADCGYSVMVVDPGIRASGDQRSTAYLGPSVQLLKRLGVWNGFEGEMAPLKALRLVDSGGEPPVLKDSRVFQPADLGAAEFGWNVPNAVALQVLERLVQDHAGVEYRRGVGFVRMLAREGEIRVWLSNGTQVSARLLVGADGRASAVRDAAGIETATTRYGQKAMAFAARHTEPHNGISTEIYDRGGAFTTVPLPDGERGPRSSIVWMEDGRRALDLKNANAEAFNSALNARSLGFLGDMTHDGQIDIWPVVSQTAKAMTAARVALIAEAAHVFPPIGAQGLNTSLHDIMALVRSMESADDPGARYVLDHYSKERLRDVALRGRAIEAFNRVCLSDNPVLRAARTAGLRVVHDIAPLRKAIMRAGFGAAPD